MGIVIINGKRYDSVTGLMLSDQTDELAPVVAEVDQVDRAAKPSKTSQIDQAGREKNDSSPVWVGSYIDDDAEANQDKPDDIGESITVRQGKPPSKVTASPKQAEQESDSLADYVELFDSTDSAEENDLPEAAKQELPAVSPAIVRSPLKLTSARRAVHASRTLNRRFVKKPLSESGEYAESIAVRHIKQATVSTDAVSASVTGHIPDKTIDEVIANTEEDFIPVLTKSQATNLRALSKSASDTKSSRRTKSQPDSKSAINLSRSAPTDYDELMDDRIDQLTKILQASDELDRQEKARVGHRFHQPGKHRFRFSTIMATAGAMAVIAGLGVYIALPTISVRLAASRAGINARNPYTLTGYTQDNNIATQPGKMTISYKSDSGNNGYSITQESDRSTTDYALRLNVSRQNGGTYQEMDVNGKTVLLYGNKATWLAGDMRYTIDGSDLLDGSQLRDIVKSL